MVHSSLLVTGAAGFIGSNFLRVLDPKTRVIVLDKLTYAGRIENLQELIGDGRGQVHFVPGDITDSDLVASLLRDFQPQAIVNFAAESHVDNSITGPLAFINTNINGVFNLLDQAKQYWQSLPAGDLKNNFRFLQVSTDEVYGSLGPNDPRFHEQSIYAPSSPYSASKAAADHLVRAWFHTYGLPTITTNCSNNYGPRQFPEKLIPRIILNALDGKRLPVYGKGENIRDWIHVEDHCRGVAMALATGVPGESYCFGGASERRNIDVVMAICKILDEIRPKKGAYQEQIEFVEDRAGHDFRYAIDDSKAVHKLGYQRIHSSFEQGLKQTIGWYLENVDWLKAIQHPAK